MEGICISASDGGMMKSFREVRGGYGYAVGDKHNKAENIEGIGVCPFSDRMSSQTAEHYGLLGLICVLHAICIKYKLTEDECFGEVMILIDNKNVVKRMEQEHDPFNISDYRVPDYDLWKLSTELVKRMPIRLKFKWIKAHQNETEGGEKVNGPFHREVEMNILVDKLATRGLEESKNMRVYKPIFSTTVIGIKTRDGKDVEDLRKYLLMEKNGNDLIRYYRERKGWDQQTIKQIDWEALEQMLRKATPLQQNRHIQTLHNWQNVGKQKGKMRDARLSIDTLPLMEPTEEEKVIHLCPLGCGETEENMYYIRCQEKETKINRTKARGRAITRLQKLRTNDGIISIINQIVKKISEDESIDSLLQEIEENGDILMTNALRGQELIGWTEMIQGFLHKGWAEMQEQHYRKEGLNCRRYNKKRWQRELVTTLTAYGKDCWTWRNEALHGKTTKEGREIRLKRIREQVKKIYRRRKEVTKTQEDNLFKVPLTQRLKFGIQALTLWVGKAEEVLRMNREQAAKYTIHHWLGSR